MGKSNKFDYTNRPNSGPNFGHIIGVAVQKEAEKVKKDAERHLQKARKQSVGGGGGDGGADIDSTRHLVDLKAPNKDLGDEGVCALADGLEIALKSSSNDASLALEDLNLSGNGITTLALARLAPIIELANCDLKTLNLAGNKIKVQTDEEAAQWEAFLRAFHSCYTLRRLDLSGNTELGSRALEILAHLHASEPAIDPVKPGGEASVLSLDEDGVTPIQTNLLPVYEEHGSHRGMTAAQFLKRRCGLRSLPYLTLHDIGLNDAGALWLSYVLQDHHYPVQLMDDLNATHAESAIKTYQQDIDSRGIDWTENMSAGKEGLHLLEKMEAIRQQIMLEGNTTTHRLLLLSECQNGAHEAAGRPIVERRMSHAIPRDRRVSIRSIRTNDGGEHEDSGLQSARCKIQRHIIAHDGANSVELWRAALKVFRASRMLLYIAPTTTQYSPDNSVLDDAYADTAEKVAPPADSPIDRSPRQLAQDKQDLQHSVTNARPSYASKAARHGSPELAITEATNSPSTPLRLQRPSTRKCAFSEGTDIDTVTEKLNVLIARPERFLRYQQTRIREAEAAGRSFRDGEAVGQMPVELVERIVRATMTGREWRVLSELQRGNAVQR